ncbi:MAG TPA: hypothetical protein VKY19_27810 [Ktedonosporobacter sp.]|jgi:hypothetical protein|nr:hypothetical protein [Ktedonosporobacter sp.]
MWGRVGLALALTITHKSEGDSVNRAATPNAMAELFSSSAMSAHSSGVPKKDVDNCQALALPWGWHDVGDRRQ